MPAIPDLRGTTNPLEVLNTHLSSISASLERMAGGDHHYELVHAGATEGGETFYIACHACSAAAGKVIHPCAINTEGVTPPPGITVPAHEQH